MKMLVKRLLLLLMAVIMTVGAFSGCVQKEVAVPEVEKQAQTDAKVQETITLTFTTWVNNRDANGNYLEENMTKEFMKQNPNIKVDFQLLTENNSVECMQKTDLMIAAGDEIDTVLHGDMNHYIDRARRGMFAPLDEYIAAEGKEYSELYSVDAAFDGKIYGLPWDIKSLFVMINKEYLDEAGLPTPKLDWTWEDYREYAKKLTKGEGKDKRYGSYFPTNFPDFRVLGVHAAYDFWPLLKKDGTSNLNDPSIKEWLQFVYDLENVDKSHLPYFEAKAGKLAYRDLFFQGKVAMMPVGTWMIQEIASSIDKYPHDWVTTFAPIPKYKDYPTGATNSFAGFISVPKTSKHKAEAYKLAKFYCDKGVYIRATGLPAKKEYNIDQILNSMMGDRKDLYDADALKAVVSGIRVHIHKNIFPYSMKVSDAVNAEIEKFLVGGEMLDNTIQNADKVVNEIINSGK